MDGYHLSICVFILVTLVSFNLAQPSHKPLPTPTDLIPDTPLVVINEIDISNERIGQYVELFDGGLGNTSMDGLALLLFDGSTGQAYAEPILLNGTATNERGYFLLTTSFFQAARGKTIVNLRNEGLNAIALYNYTKTQLEFGSNVTNSSLLDAVVYGNMSGAANSALVKTLLPGKEPLQETSYATSLSRCRGWNGLMPQAFWTTSKTPSRENNCELPNIVFNEVNVQHVKSLDDTFIELYDGGIGNQPLDGIIMAFYHSQLDLSFLAIDLTNYTTNEEGFFVIGLQPNDIYDLTIYDFQLDVNQELPSPEGIALHLASPRRFQELVSLSNYRLIDAVVYGYPNNTDVSVLHTLLPYQHLMEEVTGPNMTDLSISRCECCRRLDTSSFGEGPLTPGALNTNCIVSNRTLTETAEIYQRLVRINEVKLMDPDRPDKVGEYIELSVNGYGFVKLDVIVLVIYDSFTPSYLPFSYRTISLDGYVTNEDGYLLIGKSGMRPTPDVVVEDDDPLIAGGGGVALFMGSAEDFPDGSTPPIKTTDLLDAIVFGFPGNLPRRLVYYLTRGQDLVELQPPGDNPLPSILRCYSLRPTVQLAYVFGEPSPGVDNTCPMPPIVINELNVITSSNGTSEFLEISSSGIANFPLDTLAVFLWASAGARPSAVGGIGLYGWQTDQNGLFVIAQRRVQGARPSFPISLRATINFAPGAISIHVGRPGLFPPGSKLSNQSLVDALVFGVSKNDVIPQEMMDVLTPGREWVHEDELVKFEDVSINRCERSNGRIEYILDNLSPNATNYCPRQTGTKIIINEVNLTSTSQMYIELWDMGVGFTEMTGLQLVFFEENGKYISAQELSGQTDSRGYYLVGHITRPIPDLTIPFRFQLQKGGAVAIYSTPQVFNIGDIPTSLELMSAVVHVLEPPSQEAMMNFNILTPQSSPFVEANISVSTTSRSALSRCFNSSARISNETFLPRSKTVKSLNDCPILPDDVFINEVEVTTPKSFIPFVQKEFIELSDGGRGNTTMKYLTLVLFDGGVPFFGGFSSDLSFFSISLDGMKTNSDGYFVIGSSGLNQSVVDLPIDTSLVPFLQLGIVGIALFRGPVGAFPTGFNATNTSLVDALIYVTGRQAVEHSLVEILLPNVTGPGMIRETGSWLEGHGSISRCLGNQQLDPQAYILTELVTPRKKNNCSSITPNFETVVLINEVNLDINGFFVELYDLGAGGTSLDTLILVFYVAPPGGGQPVSGPQVVDLHGARTNSAGYYVVGSDSSSDKVVAVNFRGVASGVALYHAKTVQFPAGTAPTTQNLIDAVVTSDNNRLADFLLPGQAGVADMDSEDVERSISRCFAKVPLDMFAFLPSKPTPGVDNDCTRKDVVINEININHESIFGELKEFIELYDGGTGFTPLTGTVVVIYHGDRNNTAIRVIPLNNTQTNENGYFVIGRTNREFTPDLVINTFSQLIPNNAGAIALYHDDMRYYRIGQEPTNQNLQDAIVYGSRYVDNLELVDYLLPGQTQVIEDQSFVSGDESIERCDCCMTPLQSSAFRQGPPTPGRENACISPPSVVPQDTTTRPSLTAPLTNRVQISEIGVKTTLFSTEYIELEGDANLPLDNYFIVFYDGNGISYFSMQLEKSIGPDRFYLIGSPGLSPSPDVGLPLSFQGNLDEKIGVVALYYGYSTDVRKGSQATAKNLVDAVVYTSNADNHVGGQAGVLTTQPEQFYADLTREDSISRCFWDTVRNNNDFTQTLRTPGSANNCPSQDFKRTIQMKLTDADFSDWQNNPKLLDSLRQQIIDGINEKCKCGFNYHYITGEQLLEGSVVYQADVLAFNANQSSQIYLGFSAFVSESKTIAIGDTTYQVDKCVEDCVAMPTTPMPKMTTKVDGTTSGKGVNGTRNGKKGNASGAAAGVTVTLILLIVIGVGVVYILIRKQIICYEKDDQLTGVGISSQKLDDDSGDGTLEFKNNIYEPSY